MFIVVLTACVLFAAQSLVLAVPPPADAACRISCNVADIVEWSEPYFPDIALGKLTVQNKQATSRAMLTLYTNGDVTITANNKDTAELSFNTNTLLTEYKLEYDGYGLSQSGGRTTDWCRAGSFLKKGSHIIHISGDGGVVVTLSVRASVEKIHSENSGRYTAFQTLTACWKS